MEKENMFPVCTILYKTDKSDGWYYAVMSGSEKECENECKKLQKENSWYDFRCYVSTWHVIKPDISFHNTMPQADDIHMCTSLIYNPYDNKFYYPKEEMPYPEKRKRTTNNFNIIVRGEGEDDEYIWEPDDIDDFEGGTDITISFDKKNGRIGTIAEDILNNLPKFIKRLKKTGYANLTIEEYNYTKFLAWEGQDKVRFIIQNYDDDDDLEVPIDKLIPKDLFYAEFKKLSSKLKKYIKKHNKLYEEFKSQEEFLQSLKWEFDIQTIEKPQEYVCIDCINNKNSVFNLFLKNIKEKSEEHTIDFKTGEKLYCYKANEYYYWLSENKIFRKFFYTHKTKDTIRFMKSKDFEYKKSMSLTDIYNQLLDIGYFKAIECEFKNKKVHIYTNGQVESDEADKNEKTELEQIIKDLVKKVKRKMTISDFVKLLNNHISFISYRDGEMKL